MLSSLATFAGTALTEFSTALDELSNDKPNKPASSSSDAASADPSASVKTPPPGSPPSLIPAVNTKPDHLESQVYQEEIVKLKRTIRAMEEEFKHVQTKHESEIQEFKNRVGKFEDLIDLREKEKLEFVQKIENLEFLLSRAIHEKAKIVKKASDSAESAPISRHDFEIMKELFIQISQQRDNQRNQTQSLKLLAEYFKLTDEEKEDALLADTRNTGFLGWLI
jgi:hypothetical protein